MVHVKTAAGFEADIDETCFDDMELFDNMAALQAGDVMKLPRVVAQVLGESKQALYDFLRDERGRVPASRVGETVTEIIDQLAPKNG